MHAAVAIGLLALWGLFRAFEMRAALKAKKAQQLAATVSIHRGDALTPRIMVHVQSATAVGQAHVSVEEASGVFVITGNSGFERTCFTA